MRPHSWEKLLVFLNQRLFSILSGVTAGAWLKLLHDNQFAVAAGYWPRAVLLTLGSLSNSIQRLREDRLYGPRVAAMEVQPPLFILGHWRSGTTHLHNLLALDEHFATPNTYQVCFPHTFLTTEATSARFFGLLIPERRPQDNVRIEVGLPQEDEFALCIVTLCSPYLGWLFPRREHYYDRYLTFRDVPGDEVARWKAGFVWFLKKLTLKHGRPLLLKSPPHTARIRLLLEMFPAARFVHIHRDPYTVFQSNQWLFQTAIANNRLQRSDQRLPEEGIISRYQALYEAFFEERSLIPAGHFCEVAFEELEKDPAGEVRRVYDKLNLPGFDAFEPVLRQYAETLAGYQKNQYPQLGPRFRSLVAEAWRRGFEEWGYPP